MRPAGILLVLAMLLPQEKAELRPGLIGEYFDLDEEIDDFPNLKGMKPAVRRIDKEINFAVTTGAFNGTALVDHFLVRWTGLLRIPKDGRYMFYLESDDGSRLLLDGKLVVDNNGLHGMEERSGDAELKAGDHEVKIEFFNNTAGKGCKWRWDPGEGQPRTVPADALFHGKDKDLDR